MSLRPLAYWLVALGLALPAWADDPAAAPYPTEGYVQSVYDGDTFTLASGDKIRLRWVNCPELRPPEPFSDDARRFATDFVQGRTVQLAVSSEGRDGYGRMLAGITTDRGDLSLGLLEAGLGHVFLIPPDDVDVAVLLAAEDRARQARRGIWSLPEYQVPFHMTSFHANAPGEDAANVNGEYIRLANIAGADTSMKGWSLRNKRGDTFPLPDIVIPAGYTARIHAGLGKDASDPTKPIVVHLDQEDEIFDNEGETVELLSPDGRAVDRRTHKGG